MNGANRVILVDGELRRRAAISHLLSSAGVHVEPFENVEELTGRWPNTGVVLIDDQDGAVAAVMESMVGSGNWLPVIAFADQPETGRVVNAILEGAIDYIPWPFSYAEFLATVATAEERAGTLGNAKLREAVARSRIERLTRREREVLSGVANGHSNRLIAERLAISPRTVEIHRANMLNKIGANHTSDAIRIAIEAALIN